MEETTPLGHHLMIPTSILRDSKFSNMNNPLLVICGPTSTGKTKLALKLAHEKNGELVSADSRQIYKYLDIGTGKDLPQNSSFILQSERLKIKDQNYAVGYYIVKNIPLWLYDIISPNQQFSSSEYARIARVVIRDIWSRDKLPIVVGGTGFYIQTLIDGVDTEGIPPSEELRKQLNNETLGHLQILLKRKNPERWKNMNNSDRNNPRRLVRAIEVSQLQPQTIGGYGRKTITSKITYIGLDLSTNDLLLNISNRVEKRIQQGLLSEIESILKMGYTWSSPGLNSIGYQQWKPYFEKRASMDEVIKTWKQQEYNYAKRQRTWFNKYFKVHSEPFPSITTY